MSITTIIIRNIIMRKGKVALMVVGLALAVATLVTVVSINRSIAGAVEEKLDDYGFNIIISPRTIGMNLDYGGVSLASVNRAVTETLGRQEIAGVESVAKTTGAVRSASPKLLDKIEINGRPVLLAGADLKIERRVKDWWMIEAGRYPESSDELFVGDVAAKSLGVNIGDRLDIHGQTFTVAGLLMRTGSQDDKIIFIDLEKLRTLTGKNDEAHLIEVVAKTTEDVEPLTAALAKALPAASVRSVEQAVQIKEETMGRLLRFGLGINAIIFGITALLVFTMTASTVNERRREIGVLRAVGFRSRAIMKVILGETLLLGLAGGAIGFLLGAAVIAVLPTVAGTGWAAELMSSGMEVDTGAAAALSLAIEPILLPVALAVAVFISALAGWLPARRAARLDPVEALKAL